jgi:hypothetical protein
VVFGAVLMTGLLRGGEHRTNRCGRGDVTPL